MHGSSLSELNENYLNSLSFIERLALRKESEKNKEIIDSYHKKLCQACAYRISEIIQEPLFNEFIKNHLEHVTNYGRLLLYLEHLIIVYNDNEQIFYEHKNKKDWAILLCAQHCDHPILIQGLYDSHCDINARNYSKTTPLMLAIKNGNFQSAHLLIKLGADSYTSSISNQTPLDLANKVGNHELISLLSKNPS